MKNLPKNQSSDSSYIKIGEAAEKLGVSIDTLRRWEKAGKIKTVRTPGGTRLYATSTLSELTENPKKYQRTNQISLPKTILGNTNQPNPTTVEDLLNISRLEDNKPYQTPTTDQKWQEYIDERAMKPSEIHVHSEAELPLSSVIASDQRERGNLSGRLLRRFTPRNDNKEHKIFSFATGILAVLFLSFLVLARASNFQLPWINGLITNDQKLQATSTEPLILNPDVLAADTSNYYLDFNTDLIVEGDLAVGKTINGLTLTPNTDGFSIAGGETSRKMTVIGGDVTLNQDVSTSASPTFAGLTVPTLTAATLNLTNSSNQLVLNSGSSSTGTLTWTPTGAKTITFPDATGTVLLNSATQTITNKTISGSDNTISNIQSSALSGSYTGITGLGTITTGTWNGTKIGTGYGGTGLTSYTTGDTLYASATDTLAKLAIGTANQVLTVVSGVPAWADASGGVTSVNSLTGALTIAGAGINAISSSGTTVTITGTEADTLATVTGRGATTSTALTLSSTSNSITAGTLTASGGTINGTTIGATTASTGAFTTLTTSSTINSNTFSSTALTFAGASPAISASTAGTNISLNAGTSGKVTIAGTSTGDVDIAGGSTDTGCTISNTTGNLTCTGDISGGSTGTAGFWTRAGTSLSPATAGDSITTTGGISTTGSGTLSIAGTATFSSTINSNTFTSTALTFAGSDPVISGPTSGSNTISLNSGTGGSVLLAGGSGSTGCTIADATGNLTCSGTISSSGSSDVGFWSRNSGTSTLSPVTSGDHISTTGNISTTGSGTITSAGLLTGQLGLTVTGAAVSLNASSNYDTNINTGTSTGAISIGNSAAGAITLQSGAASVFHAPANTATAFRFTDGTNAYQTIDTRTTLSGVSAFTFAAGTAPTIASASNAEFTTLTATPPTVTLTGTTQVTSQMDSILLNAPTLTDASALTVDKAATLTINGAPISGASGSVTLTDSYALKINTASVDSGTGTVTNAYGLYVDAPTGAGTGNYAAIFAGGNIGIGDTSPDALLDLDSTSTAGGDFLITNTGIGTSGTVAGITANSATTSDLLTISGTALTSGSAVILTGPSGGTAGVTDAAFKIASDVGNIGTSNGLISSTATFDGSTATGINLYLSSSDAIVSGNTDYGIYNTVSNTGAITTQTKSVYGEYTSVTGTGGTTTTPTTNVYGSYITTTASHATDVGTVNQYGLYIANGTSATNGTATKSLLYIETPTGADNNYAAIFAGGNVGIGDTTPAAPLTVGNGDVFQVSSAGAVTAVGVNSGSGLIQGTGGLTVTGTTNINATGTSATNIGNSTGALTLASGGTSAWTNTSGNLTISTATSGTLALTSAAALNLTAGGTSAMTFTSTVTTGTTTSGGFVFTDNSLTTGTGSYFSSSSITEGKLVDINTGTGNSSQTTGKLLNLTSTSTGLSTGGLLAMDWTPGSATTATGDLFSINVGANGSGANGSIGTLLNLKDNSSSIFSVSQIAVTTSIPASFTAPGDVSIAYDINMTNPTASYIKSQAPMYLTAGEVFNSSDLVLTTYNQGSIIFNKDFAGSAVTNYLSQITGADTTSNANTDYGLYSTLTFTGNAAKTGYGLYSTVTSSSTTADTIGALDLATSETGVMTTGTRTIYGLRSQPATTAVDTGGTTNIYGSYLAPSATLTNGSTQNVYGEYIAGTATVASGTINRYGLYIDNATMNSTGTSTQYGLYINNLTGADTNYPITIAAISGTGTAAGITTGAISSTGATAYHLNLGAISGANATSHTGINIGNISGTTAAAAGITLGTLTGGTTTNYQISTGTLTGIASATNTQLNLGASVGAASATTYGINIGALSGAGTASYGINIGANSSTATTNYGMNIGAISGAGTTNYGLYVGAVSGASANYGAIFAGGNVGIGDVTPSYPLEVNTDTSLGYVAQFFNDGNNADRYGIQIQAGADDASGTTYYLNALDGDGGQVGYIANTAGTFALTDPSDIRTKTNIEDTRLNGLNIINGLNVVDFNRLNNPDGLKITGFIAQEVQQVFPQMVSVGPDGMLGISKETLVPVLVKGIQELSDKVNSYNLILDEDGNVVLSKVKIDQLVLSGDTPLDGSTNNQNYFDVAAVLETQITNSKSQDTNILGLETEIASHSAIITSNSEAISNQQSALDSLRDQIASLSAQLQSSTISSQPASPNQGESSDIANLQAQISSLSAKIASNSSQLIASGSASESTGSAMSSQPQAISDLNLTPPEVLLATTSAKLIDLSVTSDATFSGRLVSYDLSVQNIFKSLGDTFLGNTTVAGNFSIDGTLSITGSSLSTLGTLYLQNGPLTEAVDIFNGLMTIDKTGKLVAQEIVSKTITTEKLIVRNTPGVGSGSSEVNASIGSEKILTGQTKVAVLTTALTHNSKIFITPKSSTQGQTPYVELTEPGIGFVVSIDSLVGKDIDFDWFIVETR